ncbi:MAG: class I SAM-dependent methyltransferase [Candidatus Thorarchaeota archaeon]
MDFLERHTFPTLTHTFMNLVRNELDEKRCLDCGAGGGRPPVALFAFYGFDTVGIDIDEDRLKMAVDFCKDENLQVNLQEGDMRNLDFPDESFTAVFSYNTICHLSKKDTSVAMSEMIRILQPGGYIFVNFLSVDDFRHGRGEEVAPNEFVHQTLHTFFEDGEPEAFFDGTEIVWKLKWVEQSPHEGEWINGATLAYLAKK